MPISRTLLRALIILVGALFLAVELSYQETAGKQVARTVLATVLIILATIRIDGWPIVVAFTVFFLIRLSTAIGAVTSGAMIESPIRALIYVAGLVAIWTIAVLKQRGRLSTR